VFNVFDQIFAPGRKHTDDERNRIALTRQDIGDADGDPGRGPIDLSSGRVVMRAAVPAQHPLASAAEAAEGAEVDGLSDATGSGEAPGRR
jgi:hypothetical protein